MKNRSLAILMFSSAVAFASPVLAQASAPNELMQVVGIVRAIVEWVVLISLIVSIFTTSWLAVNRRSSRVEILLTGLRASVVLGVLAGCTAFILENWTPLLIFDVLFAIAQAIFFMVSASTFPKMGSERTSFGKESEP